MDLVLCHTTADFDTLGAAVGLTRLYPGMRIVLTGGAHPAVRDFLALHRDEYALIERRSVNPQQVRLIAIVDTQQRDRLGKAAEWLDLPNIEIRLYDHHPDGESDIAAHHTQIEAIGATTTLIVEQLQAMQLVPNAMEATVMALGIHVDTGSLTFDHSTARDARALAWLMEQGANLRAISEYVDPGLSPPLQQLLTLALDTLQTEKTPQGYTLAWVLLPLAGFTAGLSSVASRLMELTEIDALLLGAHYCRGANCQLGEESGDVLTLIGRSQIDGTNLNQLLKPLGGGGHPRAASANLHNIHQPQETLVQLIQQLKAQIPHPPTARELMSSPVRTIRPETTIHEAQRILLRYGHSGLSVVNTEGKLVGIISRRDLDIALHHGFSHAPVKGYMTTTLKTIHSATLLPEIESLMVTYDVGRLPVLENGQLIGIVTRTDVLRQLHKQGMGNGEWGVGKKPVLPSLIPALGQAQGAPTAYSLLPILKQRLIPELWMLLTRAAEIAEDRGWQLFVVGGAVRDLLLALLQAETIQNGQILLEDIDLVVDGFHRAADAEAGVELARSLQALYPAARLEIHGKFQTAALLWHNDPVLKSLWVDIATARTEFYPHPAANPEVEASSIQQDLYRRDFTINAMAVRLTAPAAGELLDFFGGVLDLQAKQVRVLHANSFIEDPTRIYRAVRFAVRLGFVIDAQTEGYIRHGLAQLSRGIISGIYDQGQTQRPIAPALQTRLKSELKYILQTPYWKPALQLLADLDALRCIHPSLEIDRDLWRQLRWVERWLGKSRGQGAGSRGQGPGANRFLPPQTLPDWLLLLEVILAHLAPEHRGLVATNLQLPADSIERLQKLAGAQLVLVEELPDCDRPSQMVELLNQFDVPLLMLIAIRSDRALRRQIWQYFTHWSAIKPPLNGNALKALGYKPGPQFKQILEALTAAALDGEITSPTEASAFLEQYFPLEV